MKLLRRSRTHKFLGGVCGGIGDYSGTDPIIWRLIFLLGAPFSGVLPFLSIYIVMWIVIPREDVKPNEKTENV